MMKIYCLVVMACPLFAITTTTAARIFPSPRPIFQVEFADAQVEGIAQDDSAGSVYLSVNKKWQDNGSGLFQFVESWVYRLDGDTGETVQSQRVGQNGSTLGACALLDDSLLVINPGTLQSNNNEGIVAVQTSNLETAWTSNIVRESDKGVPPRIVNSERIVYHSSNAGIVVFDREGRVLWAATNIHVGRIEVTDDNVYVVDKTPRMGFPLNVYSLLDGQFRGSSGPLEGARTNGGVVMSPDSQHVYTVRSGINGGLYRNRADFVFVPADVLTSDISSGT